MKELVISKPDKYANTVQGSRTPYHFGFYEMTGRRDKMEDALAWQVLPEGCLQNLLPVEIAYRLWTSYRLLDEQVLAQPSTGNSGTTASTTVYDGRGNLITATLGDAVSFAAIYDKNNLVRGVVRLNQVTHNSGRDPKETQRIIDAGGYVQAGRVNNYITVTRAIGDLPVKNLVCSDASIDITSTAAIASSLQLNQNDISCIKIIITCDGFTEPAENEMDPHQKETLESLKNIHEKYLLRYLLLYNGTNSEKNLAKYLANTAYKDNSGDNISVLVQTLPQTQEKSFALLQGIYDGHAGTQAACHVADNIGRIFLEQCQLTPRQYATQMHSVMKHHAIYQRDNPTHDHSSAAASSSSSFSPVQSAHIKYSDSPDTVSYVYLDCIPEKKVSKGRINLAALSLYGFYRKSVYNSYKEKPDLADDIRNRKKEFTQKDDSKLNDGLLSLYNDPLYHYSVAASLGAMQEWKTPAEKIHTYMAYEEKDGSKQRIGFVHFNEKAVDGKPVVYIAQAGVEIRGKGIGRHLMECVLSHYPAGTEFYILTRVFNTDAKNLYEKRLGFTPVEEVEITALGYDNRYCGFKRTTTLEDVDAIKTRQHSLADEPLVDTVGFRP